jgi:hypothetical protein
MMGSAGLCEVRRELPPTDLLIWARNNLTRSGTAIPTTAKLSWSQNPLHLKALPFKVQAAVLGAALNLISRNPWEMFTASMITGSEAHDADADADADVGTDDNVA